MTQDVDSMFEDELVDEHKENHKKIDRVMSQDKINKLQSRNYKIRDALVENHGWSRAEANELIEE